MNIQRENIIRLKYLAHHKSWKFIFRIYSKVNFTLFQVFYRVQTLFRLVGFFGWNIRVPTQYFDLYSFPFRSMWKHCENDPASNEFPLRTPDGKRFPHEFTTKHTKWLNRRMCYELKKTYVSLPIHRNSQVHFWLHSIQPNSECCPSNRRLEFHLQHVKC